MYSSWYIYTQPLVIVAIVAVIVAVIGLYQITIINYHYLL